jgi:hypothetical protein
MLLVKTLSTLKLMKEDKTPIEIIENLYIGSVGAAYNKEALLENKITHIVVAASNIKQYHPDVKFIFI